jgi:hypothetical protein
LDVSLRAFDLTADGFFIRSGAVSASVFSRGGEKDIRKIATFAVLFIAVTAFSAPVMAVKKCSVGAAAVEKAGGYANAVKAAVKDASSCKRAYKTFAACQLGSSADNALADIVQSKCEPLFMGKASSATKKAIKRRKTAATRSRRKTRGQCIKASPLSARPEPRGILPANIRESAHDHEAVSLPIKIREFVERRRRITSIFLVHAVEQRQPVDHRIDHRRRVAPGSGSKNQ